jgi:two-component system phosphate regulon response regulator PhoB
MCNSTRIIVVEDDPIQQVLLSTWLKADGYQVELFGNGLDARNYLADHRADLLILDWDVPGISGDRLLSWVRGRSNSTVPTVFQTVRGSEADIVQILDTGADDFLTKPLDRMVLLARIRAVLRRFRNASTDKRRMVVGDCLLDRSNQTLGHGGSVYTLGSKEFDLLWQLATHPGTVVQRQDLHSVAWGWDGAQFSRSVDMYISRLRTSLKKIQLGWTIQSVYGKGYRLNLGSALATDETVGAEPLSIAVNHNLSC